MPFCTDKWTRAITGMGYNAIRHPRERIRPLDLIGLQNRQTIYVGRLSELIQNPPETWPEIQADVSAANLSGERTSKLDFALGLNILKGVLEGFGAQSSIDAGYRGVNKLVFEFSNVMSDIVGGASVGRFLRNAEIDPYNPVLREYLLGRGDLFVIVKTVKADRLVVHAETAANGDVGIDISLLQQALGSDVRVESVVGSKTSLIYQGSKHLVFGFQCLQIGFVDGELRAFNADPRAVSMGRDGDDNQKPVILEQNGLVVLDGLSEL